MSWVWLGRGLPLLVAESHPVACSSLACSLKSTHVTAHGPGSLLLAAAWISEFTFLMAYLLPS